MCVCIHTYIDASADCFNFNLYKTLSTWILDIRILMKVACWRQIKSCLFKKCFYNIGKWYNSISRLNDSALFAKKIHV